MTKDERAALLADLRRIGQEAKTFNYIPSRFLQDLAVSDPTELVVRYVMAPQPSEGFKRLWEERRLELSVENVAWKHRHLFAPEVVAVAEKRLRQSGFDVNTQKAAMKVMGGG